MSPEPIHSNPTAAEIADAILAPPAVPKKVGPILDVYAVTGFGLNPEVLAYALARYSRSDRSLRHALQSISEDQAASFLTQFYFEYGHRSIADLAHLPFGIENLSLLAAIEVVDEQKWDGQERSTRYQDFSRREHYCPADLTEVEHQVYEEAIAHLFDGYDRLSLDCLKYFQDTVARPATMKPQTFERTLRARSFDVARSLLPLATLTSVGQIVSARTLEGQVSRLLSSHYQEVRQVGEQLRLAAIRPGFNPLREEMDLALAELRRKQGKDLSSAAVAGRAEQRFGRDHGVAPTLVRYTEPNPTTERLAQIMRTYLHELMGDAQQEMPGLVQSVRCGNPKLEIAATLLYPHGHYPLGQIYYALEANEHGLPDAIVTAALSLRGEHEELGRAFHAGQDFIFDIHMDMGGYRDMHRHRRCTQIAQPITPAFFDEPEWIFDHPDCWQQFNQVIWFAERAHRRLADLRSLHGRSPEIADYVLPLATKRRFLMKMDLAEAVYIAELRTKAAGHISYRRVAWEIFLAIQERYPNIAPLLRVTNPSDPINPLER